MPMETAYGRAAATRNPELTDVGPGTPAGELFRRYWQPVALVGAATTTPRKIKILGEDLVMFRTRKCEPGLVHPNCAHCGASLYYGKVEDDGIRCCYHGWLFRSHPDPADPSRGGSAYVHDSLRPGSLVRYDGPRSTFPLAGAARPLFVAGGIGITPLLPMVHAVAAGAPWRLLYGGRPRTSMAFLHELGR
ncbi:Rieske 2Fe-2S domain-containing protein [Actinomadura madurae]|uniref:Rieske 2Fe-2S domain-containing protein n=1 Tax=Actinomadura madurae TaxID=1993 RepID=UPI0020D26181|nr:Rieske 2Fe-2S domain-containing protein [Actinomadura madurae]MCP9967790.1 Rieske 2Fe-2S domain-containing protein [Actinomadura madurae]MCQ0008236.1 Rieske 2Fe-2S domain-containing protein [Actinomadura madurae]MCQ0016452.1 Rieske 2Fe-2S domain-containing protein [Actinomadura madurae]